MKGFIHAAIVRRKMTLFLVVLFTIFGVYNYIVMPKQESPDFKAPYAKITTIYPGASPEEIERQVTAKIEDMAVETPNYEEIQSFSSNSVSIVILKLDAKANPDESWDVLRRKASDLQSQLPEGVGEIDINTDLTETAGMIISMSGEKYTYEELSDYAERFRKELGKINGVSRFDINGIQDKVIQVKVNMKKLNWLKQSLEEITRLIAAQNHELPLGNLKNEDAVINVSSTGAFENQGDIENLVVGASPENSSIIRLKDIAAISVAYGDSNYKIKQNGNNAILLTGYFKQDKNIIMVGEEVEETINRLKADLPGDILFNQVLYQPETVSQSVDSFIINLLEALLLIIVIVFLGMGFRNAIITSLSIPLSIVLSFSMMALMKIEIHQISIAALIIALGMLVDNSVVVNDAIQVRIDQGEDKMAACVNGVKEVNIPILTSTLTTVGAFIPLLLLTGFAGDYIRSIPQVIIVALMSSYLVATLIIPAFAFLFLEESRKKSQKSRFRMFFTNLLNVAIKRKGLTLVITLIALIGALGLATTLGLKFFPMADTDMVYMNIYVESSTDLDETEAAVKAIEAIVAQQPEVIGYTAAIGDGLPKFFTTAPVSTPSIDYAQIMLKLDLTKGGRFKTNTYFVSHLQQLMDQSVANATVTVKELEQGDPTGAPITLKLSGDDMDKLTEITSILESELQKIPGAVNVEDNLTSKVYEFNLAIDRTKAALRGLSLYELEKEVSIALRGTRASLLKQNGEEYPIIVKSDIALKEELENMGIKSSATGEKVLIRDVAQINLSHSLPSIKKFDRELSVTIKCDVLPGYSPVEIQDTFSRNIANLDLDGVALSYEGEKQRIIEYFGDLGILAIFAILIIYGILLMQFNSFKQPLVIFMTIPLSMIGSIAGLFLFGQPLSFTALMGMVSLLGMVVNNAIVLLDFINTELDTGMALDEACVTAVEKRFRPIMLTTITTVIGLIPLILTGGELFKPLAISLMFGLMISMFLTLVVVPVTFSLVMKRRRAAS